MVQTLVVETPWPNLLLRLDACLETNGGYREEDLVGSVFDLLFLLCKLGTPSYTCIYL